MFYSRAPWRKCIAGSPQQQYGAGAEGREEDALDGQLFVITETRVRQGSPFQWWPTGTRGTRDGLGEHKSSYSVYAKDQEVSTYSYEYKRRVSVLLVQCCSATRH